MGAARISYLLVSTMYSRINFMSNTVLKALNDADMFYFPQKLKTAVSDTRDGLYVAFQIIMKMYHPIILEDTLESHIPKQGEKSLLNITSVII